MAERLGEPARCRLLLLLLFPSSSSDMSACRLRLAVFFAAFFVAFFALRKSRSACSAGVRFRCSFPVPEGISMCVRFGINQELEGA